MHLKNHCRPCFNRSGEPKHAFPTVAEAEAFRIEKLSSDSGLIAYSCIFHGAHLGHFKRLIDRDQRVIGRIIRHRKSAEEAETKTDRTQPAIPAAGHGDEAAFDSAEATRHINAITDKLAQMKDELNGFGRQIVDAPDYKVRTELGRRKIVIQTRHNRLKQERNSLIVAKDAAMRAIVVDARKNAGGQPERQRIATDAVEAAIMLSQSTRRVKKHLGDVNSLFERWMQSPPKTVEECIAQLAAALGCKQEDRQTASQETDSQRILTTLKSTTKETGESRTRAS